MFSLLKVFIFIMLQSIYPYEFACEVFVDLQKAFDTVTLLTTNFF